MSLTHILQMCVFQKMIKCEKLKMRNWGSYIVVKCIPDLIRDEPRNIGIILIEGDGTLSFSYSLKNIGLNGPRMELISSMIMRMKQDLYSIGIDATINKFKKRFRFSEKRATRMEENTMDELFEVFVD